MNLKREAIRQTHDRLANGTSIFHPDRVSNAGTSDGVKKAWETRHNATGGRAEYAALKPHEQVHHRMELWKELHKVGDDDPDVKHFRAIRDASEKGDWATVKHHIDRMDTAPRDEVPDSVYKKAYPDED